MSGKAKPLGAPRRKVVKLVRVPPGHRSKASFRMYLECGHIAYRPAYRGEPTRADCYDCMLTMTDEKALPRS